MQLDDPGLYGQVVKPEVFNTLIETYFQRREEERAEEVKVVSTQTRSSHL